MTPGSCLHAGAPLPRLRWYKDAVPLGQLQDPRYRLLPGGLRIERLRPRDSGIFQCFASNEGGEVQTSTYLDVTSEYRPPEPELPAVAPRGTLREGSHPLGPSVTGGAWCPGDCSTQAPRLLCRRGARTHGCPGGPPALSG